MTTGFFRLFGFLSVFCMAIGLAVGTAYAGQSFAGTWQVADSSGEPFKITLVDDGTATANRAGEGMNGTWKTVDGTAVISWDSGWTTKISKSGDSYSKTAYKKGVETSGDPTNSSDAKKVD